MRGADRVRNISFRKLGTYLRDMFLPSEPEKSTDRIEVLLVVFGMYGEAKLLNCVDTWGPRGV